MYARNNRIYDTGENRDLKFESKATDFLRRRSGLFSTGNHVFCMTQEFGRSNMRCSVVMVRLLEGEHHEVRTYLTSKACLERIVFAITEFYTS